jgi:hypothetical protein
MQQKRQREAYCFEQSCKRPLPAELLRVHPEHGRYKLHITDDLAKHGGDDSPLTFWQDSCLNSRLLLKVVLRNWSGNAAALGVKPLWLAADITLTVNRRSTLTSRLMQLLKCKVDVGLLGESALRDKLCIKLLEDDLEFQSFDGLLQFEEQEQITEHARLRLAQQGEEQQVGNEDDALANL